MPIGNGGGKIPAKGRPLAKHGTLKRGIVEVRAENNNLANALMIAIAKLSIDPNYKAFIQGRKVRPFVDCLLAKTGIDMTNGGVIPELMNFQEHFNDFRFVVLED
jgi:hypothetical protein